MTRVFWTNLILLLVAGTLLCGWLIRYTDHFEFVGGLLALGGLFSWLAFVIKVIPEDERKDAQQAIFEHVFLNQRTAWCSAAVVVVVVVLFASFVTLEVTSSQSTATRVRLYPAEASSDAEYQRLGSGGGLRKLVFCPLMSTADWQVELEGFPPHRVSLGGWDRRVTIDAPYDFYQPTILVGYDTSLATRLAQVPHEIVITVAGKSQPPIKDAAGRSLWIGGTAEMAVPGHIESLWQNQLRQSDVRAKLLNPKRIPVAEPLLPDSVVTVEIRLENETFQRTTWVRPALRLEDNVQSFLIDK